MNPIASKSRTAKTYFGKTIKIQKSSPKDDGIFAGLDRDVFDHADPSEYMKKFSKGMSRELIAVISKDKNEPEWMMALRLKAYELFLQKPVPTWGADLTALNFDEICFFAKAADKKG